MIVAYFLGRYRTKDNWIYFLKQIRKLLISEKKQRKYTFVFFNMDGNIAYFKLI
jgi:hypothetical protein